MLSGSFCTLQSVFGGDRTPRKKPPAFIKARGQFFSKGAGDTRIAEYRYLIHVGNSLISNSGLACTTWVGTQNVRPYRVSVLQFSDKSYIDSLLQRNATEFVNIRIIESDSCCCFGSRNTDFKGRLREINASNISSYWNTISRNSISLAPRISF